MLNLMFEDCFFRFIRPCQYDGFEIWNLYFGICIIREAIHFGYINNIAVI